jgi:hypothetical protein
MRWYSATTFSFAVALAEQLAHQAEISLQARPTITTPPLHERRETAQSVEYFTVATLVPGEQSYLSSVGSVCGFVTSDIRESVPSFLTTC